MGSNKVVWCVDMPEIRNNLSGTIYAYIQCAYFSVISIALSSAAGVIGNIPFQLQGLALRTKGQGTEDPLPRNRNRSSASAQTRTFFRLAPTQSRAQEKPLLPLPHDSITRLCHTLGPDTTTS